MADRVIKYKGEFDASQILASLKKVRSEMEKGGVDSSIFKGVDKDIEKTEKLITQMMAKLQTGFKDQKEVIAFEKQIAQVSTDLSKIGIGLKNANLPENFKAAAAQITKMGNNLQNTVDSLAKARQETLAFADAQQKSGRYTKAQAQAIKDAVDNEEELLQAVKRVNEEQSKKAGASLTKSLTRTKDGVISDTTRKSMAQSITTDYSNENTLALAGAAAGIQDLEKYKQVMSSVVLEGKTLKEAMDSLQVEFNENDKEILESDNFLKIYAQDLKTLAFAAAETAKNEGYSVAKGNISKQANIIGEMGASNISGEFVANTSGYDASIEKVHTLEAEILNLKSEIASLKGNVDASVNATNAKLDEENINLQQNSEAWRNSGQATREAAASADNFNNTFNNLQNIAKQVLSLTSAWRMFRQQVVNTYNDVKELDKSFAKIAMVTNYSVGDLWQQYDEYAEMANKLGQSTQSVIEASGLFYQQGLKTKEALALTEDTMKLATLAGLDFAEATSQMTAALRAFHMEMDQGSHITDVYAELAAHAAADVQGIAYAMSKTASIANSAGMSFENTSAFLTQMIETTQEAPENIGTAMKTIIARFTELKNNVAGTADSEFEDLDYNKVDKALKSVGVSIKDATGQFRNLDEVFLELSAKWNDLDRNSQRYIATIAAGSRQQSRFIAMMENYDRTVQLVNTAYDSAGKSSEQFAKFSDSVEFKVNKLKNTWEQFRINLLSSEGYKNVLDMLTKIVSKFEGIDLKKLIALAPVVITIGRTLATSWIKGISDGLSKGHGLIDKFVGKLGKNKQSSIEIKANIEDAKKKIEELEAKKALLVNDNESIQIIKQEELNKLDQAEKELEELKTKEDTFLDVDRTEEELDEFINKLDKASEKVEDLNNKVNDLDTREANNNEQIETLDENVGIEKQTKKRLSSSFNKKAIGTSIGTALGASIGTAATMAFAGSFDLSEIAKTTAVQNGISAFTSLLSGNWQQALGQALVGGIAWVAGWIADNVEEANEKLLLSQNKVYALEKQIENLTAAQEVFNEKLDEANQKYDEQKDHWDAIKEASETYKELKTRIALTEEQEEQLQTAQNTLIEECPELVTRYDAAGQAIIDMGNNFDTVIEKQRQLFKEAAIEQNNAEMASQMVSVAIADAEVQKAKEQLKELNHIYDTYYVANGSGNGEKISAKKLFEQERSGFEESLEKRKQYVKESYGAQKKEFEKDVEYYEKVLDEFDRTLELHNNNYYEAIEDLKATTDYIDEQYKSGSEIFDLEVFDEPALDDLDDAEDYMRTMIKQNSTAKEVFIDILEELKDEGAIGKIDEEVVKDIQNLNKKTANELIDIIDDAGGKDDEKIWEKVREKFREKTAINNAKTELEAAQAEAEAVLQDQTQQMMSTIADGIQIKLMDDANGEISISDELATHMQESIEKWITNSSAVKTELKAIQDKLNADLKDLSDDPEEQEQAIEQARQDTEAALKKAEDDFWNQEGIQDIVDQFDDLTELQEQKVLQYYDDLGKVTLQASKDTIEQLRKANVGEEVLAAMEANVEALEEEVTQAQLEISQLMGISPSYGAGLAYKENSPDKFISTHLGQIFDEAAPELQLSLSNALKNALGDDSTDEAKSYFIKHLNGFLADVGEGVDATVLTRLLTEDWNDVSFLNLEEKAEEFGREFEESFGGEFEEGVQLYKDFIVELNQSSDLIDLSINGPAIEEYTEKFSEQLSNTVSKFSGISSVIQNQLKNGFISFSESQSFKEACSEIGLKAEDYLTYQADGSIIFDAKAFEEAVEGTITNEEEIVAQIKQQTKEQIEQLELQLALIKGDEAEVAVIVAKAKKQKAFNKQLRTQVKYLKALGRIDETALRNISDDDEDISDYKQSEDVALVEKNLEEKLTSKQSLLEDLEAGNYGDLQELLDIAAAGQKEIRDTYNSAVESALGNVETLEKALTDAQKSVDDAHEAVVSALEDVQEAEEKVIEETEKLNEALYGTDNYKNKSDSLYNYTTMLERLQKAADNAKDALDDISEGDDVQANVDTYLQKARDEAAARQAENEVIRQSIQNYQNVLNDRLGQEIANMNSQYGANMDINISDFYYKKGDRWAINFQALNAANIPDEISDYVEETVAQMNKLEDNIEDNAEAIKKREKEIRELRKKGVQAQITLENEVANVLKEKYQEEVDNLKDKYKSMEEADNEYVDALKEAIDKQRQLRSRQNEWENLATKEKKLSLLSRDTSGANKLTTQKLQKEIQSDREKLLDNSVDAIINNLKELYETQKETRDSEIEYQEALLENTNFIKEANTIIQSWESADDAISFFYNNVKNISEMSEAQLEQETESWKDMYEAHTLYLATNTKNFNDTLQHFEDGAEATNEEIQRIIKETSETLTNEATRSLNEISSKTSEAIKSAQDAVTDALDALAEKQKAYNEALENERQAVVSLAQAQRELNEARDAYKEALGQINNKPTSSSTVVQESTGPNITELGSMFRGLLKSAVTNATDYKTGKIDVDKINLNKLLGDFNKNYNAAADIETATDVLKAMGYHGLYNKDSQSIAYLSRQTSDIGKFMGTIQPVSERSKYKAFKTGGLVDYTGPAWVDGSPTKPEAFLNPEDTERIGKAAELLSHLSDLLNFNTSPTENITNNSVVGDTTINVTVNVENISDDYDVDLAIERVKQEIVDAAAFTGANVILTQ